MLERTIETGHVVRNYSGDLFIVVSTVSFWFWVWPRRWIINTPIPATRNVRVPLFEREKLLTLCSTSVVTTWRSSKSTKRDLAHWCQILGLNCATERVAHFRRCCCRSVLLIACGSFRSSRYDGAYEKYREYFSPLFAWRRRPSVSVGLFIVAHSELTNLMCTSCSVTL